METNELRTLGRNCEAIRVPSGDRVTVPAGTRVRVMQSLGGTYSVATTWGEMLRIAGKDADAIGEEADPLRQGGVPAEGEGPVELEELVWDQLRTCFDPEIPVNIVDLGLVYGCRTTPLPLGGNRAEVKFTLTAPGCGMGDVLKADIETKLMGLPGIEDIDVEVVIDPPWDPSRMSRAARLELGVD